MQKLLEPRTGKTSLVLKGWIEGYLHLYKTFHEISFWNCSHYCKFEKDLKGHIWSIAYSSCHLSDISAYINVFEQECGGFGKGDA